MARRINVEELFIVLFIGATLLPVAINQFISVNKTGWPTALATIWDNIPIIGLVGILVGMMYKYMKIKR